MWSKAIMLDEIIILMTLESLQQRPGKKVYLRRGETRHFGKSMIMMRWMVRYTFWGKLMDLDHDDLYQSSSERICFTVESRHTHSINPHFYPCKDSLQFACSTITATRTIPVTIHKKGDPMRCHLPFIAVVILWPINFVGFLTGFSCSIFSRMVFHLLLRLRATYLCSMPLHAPFASDSPDEASP